VCQFKRIRSELELDSEEFFLVLDINEHGADRIVVHMLGDVISHQGMIYVSTAPMP
jgi:hypothetical protein